MKKLVKLFNKKTIAVLLFFVIVASSIQINGITKIETASAAICGNDPASSTCSETIIEAQIIRNEEGTGSCQISSGFPVPPGLVTEQLVRDGKIIVKVDGVEVSANISALRGRHYDGTIRSILIQFQYDINQDESLLAEVIINGNARTNLDPEYILPTYEMVQNNNIILPTNSNYLVSTQIYFRNILSAGVGSEIEERLYSDLAEDRFDALSINQNLGTASYENVSAMLGMWSRTGDIKYQKEAIKQTLNNWLDYNTPPPPPPDCGDDCPDKLCRADAVANPDKRNPEHSHCGLPAEWHSARTFSYAQMYLMTGYRDFWGIVAYQAQMQQTSIVSQEVANEKIISQTGWDLPRFNYAAKYGAMLAALMIDATITVDGSWNSGREFDWISQLDWTIDGIIEQAWDLKWVSYNNGTGLTPADGTIISQEGVTAELLGVYEFMNYPKQGEGNSISATGYLQVKNISGGNFSVGSLTGVEVSATGSEEDDYRQGMTGTRSNSPLKEWNGNPYTANPTFQLVFPTNFLIDYYLYVKRDSRIPALVKTNLDIVLKQIRPLTESDPYYGVNGGIWGSPQYGKPYLLENPINTISKAPPCELPEYGRIISFVLKTNGDEEVSGRLYSQWYDLCIDTANVTPINVLTWQWKLYGQFYGWGLDAPWMMAQDTLLDYGPETMRAPTQWGSIPNEIPDMARDTEVIIRADVNQDSQINAIDAMLTFRNSLGLDMSQTSWQASDTTGDVNCDGNSNLSDAMLLLRYSLGLDMNGTDWCES